MYSRTSFDLFCTFVCLTGYLFLQLFFQLFFLLSDVCEIPLFLISMYMYVQCTQLVRCGRAVSHYRARVGKIQWRVFLDFFSDRQKFGALLSGVDVLLGQASRVRHNIYIGATIMRPLPTVFSGHEARPTKICVSRTRTGCNLVDPYTTPTGKLLEKNNLFFKYHEMVMKNHQHHAGSRVIEVQVARLHKRIPIRPWTTTQLRFPVLYSLFPRPQAGTIGFEKCKDPALSPSPICPIRNNNFLSLFLFCFYRKT